MTVALLTLSEYPVDAMIGEEVYEPFDADLVSANEFEQYFELPLSIFIPEGPALPARFEVAFVDPESAFRGDLVTGWVDLSASTPQVLTEDDYREYLDAVVPTIVQEPQLDAVLQAFEEDLGGADAPFTMAGAVYASQIEESQADDGAEDWGGANTEDVE